MQIQILVDFFINDNRLLHDIKNFLEFFIRFKKLLFNGLIPKI